MTKFTWAGVGIDQQIKSITIYLLKLPKQMEAIRGAICVCERGSAINKQVFYKFMIDCVR